MVQWFYGQNGVHAGPIAEHELHVLISNGAVTPETMLWREGMPAWLTLREIQAGGGIYLNTVPVPSYPMYGPQTSGLAIASLVCGALGILCAPLLGIAAVITGHLALGQIDRAPYPMGGRGLAIAGLVLGYLFLALTLFWILRVYFAMASHR